MSSKPDSPSALPEAEVRVTNKVLAYFLKHSPLLITEEDFDKPLTQLEALIKTRIASDDPELTKVLTVKDQFLAANPNATIGEFYTNLLTVSTSIVGFTVEDNSATAESISQELSDRVEKAASDAR